MVVMVVVLGMRWKRMLKTNTTQEKEEEEGEEKKYEKHTQKYLLYS